MGFIHDALMEARKVDTYALANKLMRRYNGAPHADADIPDAVPGCINEINLPYNMRMKSLDVIPIDDETIEVNYITQEPFDSKDFEALIAEVKSAAKNLTSEPIYVTLEAVARDGKDEGYGLYDFNTADA